MSYWECHRLQESNDRDGWQKEQDANCFLNKPFKSSAFHDSTVKVQKRGILTDHLQLYHKYCKDLKLSFIAVKQSWGTPLFLSFQPKHYFYATYLHWTIMDWKKERGERKGQFLAQIAWFVVTKKMLVLTDIEAAARDAAFTQVWSRCRQRTGSGGGRLVQRR